MERGRGYWYGPEASPPDRGSMAIQVSVTETSNQTNKVLPNSLLLRHHSVISGGGKHPLANHASCDT